MANGVTVNQFVCLFPSGTRIKIHMIFADREKTERFNDEDFGVWGDGHYYGITRYPVGECTIHEARMLKPFIKNHRYDLDVWAFEPKYCENLEKLREPKEET